MAKREPNKLTGIVTSVLRGKAFRVALPNGQQVPAYISNDLRKNFIRLEVGDKVSVEMSRSSGKARITSLETIKRQ